MVALEKKVWSGFYLLRLILPTAMQTGYAHKMLQNLTLKQGEKYGDPESKKDIQPFIEFFNLDISESLEDITTFNNFNEFFYRKLKPGSRPIHDSDDPVRTPCSFLFPDLSIVKMIAVSAADCRMHVFPSVDEATRLWIKG